MSKEKTNVEQEYVTICMPFIDEQEWTEFRQKEIEAMLDELGNPVRPDIKEAINALAIVHFFSINILPWDKVDRKAFLIFEATVDGSARDAIEKLAQTLGDTLFPILRRACGIQSRDEISKFLLKHHYDLKQGDFYNKRFSITGLPFNGKPDLTVKDIKRNQSAVNDIRAFMATDTLTDNIGPVTRFQKLKEEAEKQGHIFKLSDEHALSFADRQNAPWLKKRSGSDGFSIGQILPLISRDFIVLFGILFITMLIVISAGFNLENSDVFQGMPGEGLSKSSQFTELISFAAKFLSGLLILIVKFINVFALTIGSSLVILAAILGYAVYRLRKSEAGYLAREGEPFDPKLNYPLDQDPDPKIVSEIMKRENHPGCLQNHMYHSVVMISGGFRRVMLRFAFRVIGKGLTIGMSRPGFLGDVGTVHAARWFIPPGSQRLIFASNYDGNWESYLEDFITKVSTGVTGVWSNTQGFPKTKYLFFEGAEDGDRLKRYARRTMMPSLCWYSAYPDLTTEQIKKHALIFDGLSRIDERDSSNAEAWYSLFESVPRPTETLEDDKIQNIFFGNSKNLEMGACIAINFGAQDTDSLVRIKEALNKKVWHQITFGPDKPEEEACYVAFSASGLRKLGMEDLFDPPDQYANGADDETRQGASEFAPAFGMDMDAPERRRLLGDGKIDEWHWGHGDKKADMVLLCYWKDKNISSTEIVAKWEEELSEHGLSVIHSIDTGLSTDKNKAKDVEAFGFKDGISQPIIRGLNKGQYDEGSIHYSEPGEFILGYRDNRGYYPPTPHVRVQPSKNGAEIGYLPALPNHMPQRYPEFTSGRSLKDFGRNGSYLVIRQIEQHVQEFEKFCDENKDEVAGTFADDDDDKKKEMVGALMVGRWKNGNPLVHNSTDCGDEADQKLDNEFLFWNTDPQGLRCPLGSHVRRSNPRDSLDIHNEHELSVSNRHRILRRGRSYWKGDSTGTKTGKEGLLFMCLNSDIERQFEFVQSTWIKSTAFHGLENEEDPLLSNGGGRFSFGNAGDRKHFDKISKFTTLRGGGYFFLPGKQSLLFLVAPRNSTQDELESDGMAYADNNAIIPPPPIAPPPPPEIPPPPPEIQPIKR